MKFKNFSKDEAIEILAYLAGGDPLVSLRNVPEIKVEQVRELFKEIAQHLEKDLEGERAEATELLQDGLSAQARHLLDTLSPREERLLYRSFKLN